MANATADPRVFVRGSAVLDYWLAHAEGLTVQPSGARVEEVVASPPAGNTEALIVRTRMTRRLKEIPADSIVAVEPLLGHLLLEQSANGTSHRVPRPSPETIVAARVTVRRGSRFVGEHAVGAARTTHAGSRRALRWLRPRAAHTGRAAMALSRAAATAAVAGVAWLAPRIAAAAGATAAAVARAALAGAAVSAHGIARGARGIERAAATAAERRGRG
jgi:hypothetical protein